MKEAERPKQPRFKRLAVALGVVAFLVVGSLLAPGTRVNEGWTPLHEAAATDALATAKVLLENGADVNA